MSFKVDFQYFSKLWLHFFSEMEPSQVLSFSIYTANFGKGYYGAICA